MMAQLVDIMILSNAFPTPSRIGSDWIFKRVEISIGHLAYKRKLKALKSVSALINSRRKVGSRDHVLHKNYIDSTKKAVRSRFVLTTV